MPKLMNFKTRVRKLWKMGKRVYGKKRVGAALGLAEEFERLGMESPVRDVPVPVPGKNRKPLAERGANEQFPTTQKPKPTKKEAVKKDQRRDLKQQDCPVSKQSWAKLSKAEISYLQPLTSSEVVNSEVEVFDRWAAEISASVVKVGDGSYGDVYRVENPQGTGILKVMPIRVRSGPGSEDTNHTDPIAALNEISLSAHMQGVEGFVEFREAWVLRGSLPLIFRQAKALFVKERKDECDDESEVTHPSTQFWVVIEMADAGRDIASYRPTGIEDQMPPAMKCLSVSHVWDIFWGVTTAIAKGEAYAQFEHRDLHPGNICVKEFKKPIQLTEDQKNIPNLPLQSPGPTPTPPLLRAARSMPIRYSPPLRPPPPIPSQKPFRLNHTGLEVTIIDYTLSRATLPDGRVIHNPMLDQTIFTGRGDPQYEVYRVMKRMVGEGNWEGFKPETNVLWLGFILKVLQNRTMEPLTGSREVEMQQILNELLKGVQKPRRAWQDMSASQILTIAINRNWIVSSDVIPAFQSEDDQIT
ncbi:hypothetical protein MMC09_005867 [Bachmanniomyces sp. S44760]|nr:hypothetical protein [Bachmanniomyces sp. S44760]